MRSWLKSKWILLFLAVAIAVGIYALIGFKIVPRIIRSQAIDYAQTELKKPLTLGEIKVNPFTFELDMRDIALKDGTKNLLSLQHLFVDFQASSLFKRAFVFNTVLLEKPFAHAVVRPDGSLNLIDLLPKEKNEDPIPNIWIGDFSVKAGQVNFSDQSRELKPVKNLSPISFNLKNFKTRQDGGGFELAAMSDEQEGFAWKGSLSLQPISSKGTFKVESLKALSAYEFLSEELPFQLSDGSISLSGSYDFAYTPKQGLMLTAVLPKIQAAKLAIRPKNGVEDWITIPGAEISDARLDLQKQSASAADVAVHGLAAKAWLNADGTLSIEQLFDDGKPAISGAAGSAPASNPAADWVATIGKVTVSDARFDVEDRSKKPAGKFLLAPSEFTATGLSLDLSKPVPITLSTTINGKAPLHVTGTIVPSLVTAELDLEVSGMPLAELLAYLPDYPGILLKSGIVGAKGHLQLDEKARIAYRGDASAANFVLLDVKNKSELVSVRNTAISGIDFRQSPDKVAIKTITLDKPVMQVVVTPQQTINLLDLLDTPTSATQQSGAKAAMTDLSVTIGKLVLRSGAMAFADFSIKPNFRAQVEGLNGQIQGISTNPDAIADIDLNGYIINKYSPVEIKGKTSIFDLEKNTDIQMAFRNIELPVFNPYSGRFAGYAIAKGKLTTELHYRINDKKLVADHRVILDQLTWGEATDSKEKVSLPIRLGTALLKDKNGVIDLNLPVTGSLDDPKFRIGPIVWQVIKNVLMKAVSAPFSALGSLFAGAENAQYVDFAPGSASMPDAAQKSLAELAKALVDKPELNLDIPAGVLAELDRDALAQQKLQTALLATGKPGKNPANYAEWETKQQLDALETLYKQQFGQKPDIPKAEPAPAVEDAGWRAKRAAKKSTEAVWLETQLLPKYQPSQAELVALGKARGDAVQDVLLKDGTLAPTRVFLNANVPLKENEGKVRMELQMK